jgi:long-chain acyl-CoA synthetase
MAPPSKTAIRVPTTRPNGEFVPTESANAPLIGTDLEERFTDSPGRVVAWLGRQVEIGVGELDLSAAQYRTLIVLARGETGPSSLAGILAVRPPSVTAMIDGLIARGLVERHASAEDRRCVSHMITDAGRDLLREADRAADDRLANLSEFLENKGLERQANADLALWGQALQARRARRIEP